MKFLVLKIPMGRIDYRGCPLSLNGMHRQSQVSLPQDSPSLGYSDYLMAVHPKGQVDYFNLVRMPRAFRLWDSGHSDSPMGHYL